MLTAEQTETRRSGLGGSDAAAIAGLDDYRTAVDVWLEKTGRMVNDEESEPAYWGQILEETVAQEFARRTGLSVRRHNATIFHPQHQFMLAHIDRRITGEKRGLECKTINAWSGSKLEQPLDKHILQVQHYMAVTGFEMFHVAYLIGGQRFATFEVPRDPEMIEMLIDAEADFWRYVERDEMPPLDYEHRTTEDLLRRIYPGTDGSTVELGADIEHWHRVRQESMALAKRYETAADAAKFHIMEAMKQAAVGMLPDRTRYTRKVVTRKPYQVEESSYVDFRYSNKQIKEDNA